MNEPIFCPNCGEEMEKWDVGLHMCHACGELKDTAPRVRPKCKCCTGEFTELLLCNHEDNYPDSYFELKIMGNEIILCGDVRGRVQINYCPMCGRKLEECVE